MNERRLKSRKRAKRTITGRAVRLSNTLLDWIEPRRKSKRSYDDYLRWVFGLPDWQGTPQPLVEGMLEVTTGRFFPKVSSWAQAEEAAYEVAILEAARAKTRKVLKPIRVREIPYEGTLRR